MRAAFYDGQGPAAEVLRIAELDDPVPAAGEVRVRITVSGVSPGDTKKRAGWPGSPMVYSRVVPHSDGAGVIDAVGEGVDAARIGTRVWTFGAQSYRAFGTAAEMTCLPQELAVPLPDGVTDEVGACLGIPGITAHRAVFADGPVAGSVVLVQGVLGAVGSLAAQLARWGGATVIGTCTRSTDILAASAVAHHVVALDGPDPAAAVREFAPGGVDRVVEVSFSDNLALDVAVLADNGVVASYATRHDPTTIEFWPMAFANVTLRMLGSDDFPVASKRHAADDLTAAAADGALAISVAEVFPLSRIAEAHDRVDSGGRGRVLVSVAGLADSGE
ncbi:MAG: NADPH:quinone reductase [Williamsia sp.]|nr:NADPH:quinone reductase [Williamsia sp.]